MALLNPPPKITNVAPAVTDDGTEGYQPGAWWFDTAANVAYWCESNATGAAVWNSAGGVSAHNLLSALAWTGAGHTASTVVSQVAGFTNAGAANLQRVVLNPARRFSVTSYVRAGQTGRDTAGLAAGSTFGSNGGVNNLQLQNWTASAATIASRFGIYNSVAGTAVVRLSDGIEFDIVIKTGPDITSQRLWILFSSANPTNADGDDIGTAGISSIGIRYSTSVPDTNWMVYTSNGVSQTATSSGVPVTADTLYTVQLRATASLVGVRINGAAEVTVATTLPSSSAYLLNSFYGILLANSNREFNIGNFWIDMGSTGTWP